MSKVRLPPASTTIIGERERLQSARSAEGCAGNPCRARAALVLTHFEHRHIT